MKCPYCNKEFEDVGSRLGINFCLVCSKKPNIRYVADHVTKNANVLSFFLNEEAFTWIFYRDIKASVLMKVAGGKQVLRLKNIIRSINPDNVVEKTRTYIIFS